MMLLLVCLLGLLNAASSQQCTSSPKQSSYIDITVTTGVGLPVWASSVGLRRNWRARSAAIAEGDEVGSTRVAVQQARSLSTMSVSTADH